MGTDPVTILVPTARRPALLRSALASVAAQTVAHRISRVLVSGNAGDSSSRSIAAEFAVRLPIDYVQREPALPPNEHFTTLVSEVKTPYAAVLHDDDWWTPYHLQTSLLGLDADASAAASFGSFFETTSESAPFHCSNNLICWFAAGFPATTEGWSLSSLPIALACLPHTTLRYSTLVARTPALNHSNFVYNLGNPFDTDRMLPLALSFQGPLIFQPVPSTFIRLHLGQDARRYDYPATLRHMSSTTGWLIDQVRNRGLPIEKLLEERIAACPQAHRKEVLESFCSAWCIPVLQERNISPPDLNKYFRFSRQRRFVVSALRAVLPPFLVGLGRKILPRHTR